MLMGWGGVGGMNDSELEGSSLWLHQQPFFFCTLESSSEHFGPPPRVSKAVGPDVTQAQ